MTTDTKKVPSGNGTESTMCENSKNHTPIIAQDAENCKSCYYRSHQDDCDTCGYKRAYEFVSLNSKEYLRRYYTERRKWQKKFIVLAVALGLSLLYNICVTAHAPKAAGEAFNPPFTSPALSGVSSDVYKSVRAADYEDQSWRIVE